MSLQYKYIGDENTTGSPFHPRSQECGDPKNLPQVKDGPTALGRLSSTFSRQNDDVHWYPLRIYHSSVKRQFHLRDRLDVEDVVEKTYVPEKLIDADAKEKVPALLNYIFVRIRLSDLKSLKRLPSFSQLRYVMEFEHDDKGRQASRIAFVTDREMSNFQQVIDRYNEQVELVWNNDFGMRAGQRVVITEGTFAGVEGTLKSIKKRLCVIVALKGIMAVAIRGVHCRHIRAID